MKKNILNLSSEINTPKIGNSKRTFYHKFSYEIRLDDTYELRLLAFLLNMTVLKINLIFGIKVTQYLKVEREKKYRQIWSMLVLITKIRAAIL
ncbi:hypothetical protein EfmJHP9_21510 [Enterococcus faecium]|nr:hypothetical protein EfmJHP9_21510 [Enterococcus faecium]